MNIKLVVVGKIKEKYMREAIKEYSKRLQRYCRLDIVELEDEKTGENLSDKELRLIKDREGRRILSKIEDSAYVMALEIRGKELSSEALAQKIEDLQLEGESRLVLVIGGSLGLSEEVLERADYRLSFSKMTFPHQLMRVILLEQIYRSFRIIRHEPYHK